jgi:hypothetical protein
MAGQISLASMTRAPVTSKRAAGDLEGATPRAGGRLAEVISGLDKCRR